MTCTDENARTKAHFAQEAGRVGLAVVFPDTSPRGVDIEGKSFSTTQPNHIVVPNWKSALTGYLISEQNLKCFAQYYLKMMANFKPHGLKHS